MGGALGAAWPGMTPAEKQKLHEALFTRLLHEVKDGSMDVALKARDMMEGETTTSFMHDFLGAISADNRISDGAGDGACVCGSDPGE